MKLPLDTTDMAMLVFSPLLTWGIVCQVETDPRSWFFIGSVGSSPEAKAAEGGGPASPPLFWLMVGGLVSVDNG